VRAARRQPWPLALLAESQLVLVRHLGELEIGEGSQAERQRAAAGRLRAAAGLGRAAGTLGAWELPNWEGLGLAVLP
jgi:hypothetical protein